MMIDSPTTSNNRDVLKPIKDILSQISNAFVEIVDRVFSRIPRRFIPLAFMIIPLIIYFVWIIGPTFYTFYLSITDWNGVDPAPPINSVDNSRPLLYNYERLFRPNDEFCLFNGGLGECFNAEADRVLFKFDKDFEESLINNLRWLAVFITVPTTAGLGLALIFNAEMRGSRWFKIGFYSPLVLSLPVIGLIWSWVYNPRLGLINSLLVGAGVESSNLPGWLADQELAIWAIIFAAVWRQVGYVMILYLAGLKNLDPTLIDAAQVDGASRWQLFRFVIFPLLAPVTTIIIVISVIDSLRSFDLVQVMTRGNKGTEVLANFMYTEAFNNYKMGFGAAIAVILFFISLVFIGFYLWRTVKQELET